MRTRLGPAVLCAALALATQGEALAQSAPIWRCGNAYSHQPCAQGQALDVQDARTTEQQLQAKTQAEQTHAFADSLHRENAEREAQQRREEIARQKTLLSEQAALRRAERKARVAHDKALRQRKKRRLLETRRAATPQSNATASTPQS